MYCSGAQVIAHPALWCYAHDDDWNQPSPNFVSEQVYGQQKSQWQKLADKTWERLPSWCVISGYMSYSQLLWIVGHVKGGHGSLYRLFLRALVESFYRIHGLWLTSHMLTWSLRAGRVHFHGLHGSSVADTDTLNYQSDDCYRSPTVSIKGFRMRAYKNHGYGSPCQPSGTLRFDWAVWSGIPTARRLVASCGSRMAAGVDDMNPAWPHTYHTIIIPRLFSCVSSLNISIINSMAGTL